MKQGIVMAMCIASTLSYVVAQPANYPPPATTVIHHPLTAHRYEFSALAKWENKILLIPQDCKNVVDSIFMIDSLEIEKVWADTNAKAAISSFAIKNIRHDATNKHVLFIGNTTIEDYDGFEAAVVKQDSIFYSLEGENSFCYLIKGVIDAGTKTVNLLEHILQVPDAYHIDNAGYESIAWLPQKDSLISFFECNKDTVHALAFMYGTTLQAPFKPIAWATPLYFRLTDTYAMNDSEVIGINHLFTSKSYPYERDAYIKCENLIDVENQFTNRGIIDTCFTQIIKLTLTDGKLHWRALAFISLGCSDNYEGIVGFKDGALMIVDGEPGNNPCKLIYVSLKNTW